MSSINTEIIIALLSLAGTCFGSVLGIFTSNRLTVYRIEQLEKKVDKHNNVLDRLVLLEHDVEKLTKFKRRPSSGVQCQESSVNTDFFPDS